MHRPVDWAGRVALVAALAATLGLAGCGRKGPLDAPPTANLTDPHPMTPRPSLGEASDNIGPSLEPVRPTASDSASGTPQSPPKKTFFLDFLINK